MGRHSDTCHIITKLNKEKYSKYGFLYLTIKYLQISQIFPGKLYATDAVFYLDKKPCEAVMCVNLCNRKSEHKITENNLKLLDI